MPSIGDASSREIVDAQKLRALERNAEVVRKLGPLCESLRRENEKIRGRHGVYDLRLSRLSATLSAIEAQSRRLETAIRNKAAVFDALRDVVAHAEINDEHLDALEAADLGTDEGLVRVEQALAALEAPQAEALDIRVVRERRAEAADRLRLFFRRFRDFLGDFLGAAEGAGEGQLRVHAALYDGVRRFAPVLRFAHERRREDFAGLVALYAQHARETYRREFERHLGVLQKLFAAKRAPRVGEGLGIFLESFFMIVKCETHFCGTELLLGVEAGDFAAGIFKDVFALALDAFHGIFRQQGLALVCALQGDFRFGAQGGEAAVWLGFAERVKRFREQVASEFLAREKDDLAARSRVRNVDRCIEHLAACSDAEISERLVEMAVADIARGGREDVEDLVHALRLLLRLGEAVRGREGLGGASKEVDEATEQRKKALEKAVIGYVFGGDGGKAARRTRNVVALAEGNAAILRFLRGVVSENAGDEQRRELQSLF